MLAPVAFFTYLVASIAETNRAPFDLPEGARLVSAMEATRVSKEGHWREHHEPDAFFALGLHDRFYISVPVNKSALTSAIPAAVS